MNVYVVMQKVFFKKELKRYDDDFWNVQKSFVNPNKLVYSTMDVEDRKLKKFDEIIWKTVFDIENLRRLEIKVPFTPDNIKQMENEVKEKSKIYEARYQEIYDHLEEMEEERRQGKKIDISKWKALEFIMHHHKELLP